MMRRMNDQPFEYINAVALLALDCQAFNLTQH